MVSRLFSFALLAHLSILSAPADIIAGPYNAAFAAGGPGLQQSSPVAANPNPWTISSWVQAQSLDSSLIGGTVSHGDARVQLALQNGHWALWTPTEKIVSRTGPAQEGEWHFIAATTDASGTRLFADGREIAKGHPVPFSGDRILLAPVLPNQPHFSGRLAYFTITNEAVDADAMKRAAQNKPDAALVAFDVAAKPWPVQTHGQPGYLAPQPPATLPTSKTKPQQPVAKPPQYPDPLLIPQADPGTWTIAGAWRMIAAPELKTASGDAISQPDFDASHWLRATVPGTVLTTYIDRGIFPDPDYGLNNLAIPESLNKQDYWYRTQWKLPPGAAQKRLTLTFNGINYAAEVWFNGNSLGQIKGAFVRGVYDITSLVKANGVNALAVRISPPPHPGIPHEQSIKAGPGENGGMLCLDGPTFVATEGWDWIPGIRDRNIGIWQDVELHASGAVHIGDPQVITRLPLPDTSVAELTLDVPLHNDTAAPIRGKLHVQFEGAEFTVPATAPPGDYLRELRATEVPQLRVMNPRLWWPNGYGKPELYHLQVTFDAADGASDHKFARFGIREVSYELSGLDSHGQLRRFEYAPAASPGTRVIDVEHEGIRNSSKGWVVSLVPDAETSPSLAPVTDDRLAPYLVLKVNGVRIAAKGGNWGMDDARKRVSRERLEPYFRLHRDANLNIIRNWVGQDTEQTFFDLADEYGLMVWSDFWASTQNYNLEPDDSALFLRNAADVIARYRNHPSIVIWCGRNEGVPPPAINKGLDQLVRTLDGTRYYQPASNTVNLQFSGPYKYQPAESYFSKNGRGFAVELGVPSFPTLDAFKAFVPEPDQWPMSDTWAYHDWHFAGNGAVQPYLAAQEEMFGPANNLDEFERKAQMMNYVMHRAIFEGFNAHLWTENSGRMLWMTQPAWPSTMWQILSSDYDTQASFYGVKKASEPVHIQLNLPDNDVAVVNNTLRAIESAVVKATVYDLNGKQISAQEAKLNIGPNEERNSITIGQPSGSASIVALELRDRSGRLLSENTYWQAGKATELQALTRMPQANLTLSAQTESATAAGSRPEGRDGPAGMTGRIRIELRNADGLALMNRVTLRHKDGTRILPAYYSDNYVSLLPNQTRTIDVEVPAAELHAGPMVVTLRGWNSKDQAAEVK